MLALTSLGNKELCSVGWQRRDELLKSKTLQFFGTRDIPPFGSAE